MTSDEQGLTPWVEYPLPLSVVMGDILPIEHQRQAAKYAERLVRLFSRRPLNTIKPPQTPRESPES